MGNRWGGMLDGEIEGWARFESLLEKWVPRVRVRSCILHIFLFSLSMPLCPFSFVHALCVHPFSFANHALARSHAIFFARGQCILSFPCYSRPSTFPCSSSLFMHCAYSFFFTSHTLTRSMPLFLVHALCMLSLFFLFFFLVPFRYPRPCTLPCPLSFFMRCDYILFLRYPRYCTFPCP